jgi:hypothetical protein
MTPNFFNTHADIGWASVGFTERGWLASGVLTETRFDPVLETTAENVGNRRFSALCQKTVVTTGRPDGTQASSATKKALPDQRGPGRA